MLVDQVSCIFPLRLLIVPSPGKHPRPDDDVTPEPQRVRYNSASGNIQIVEVDPAGKFIQIRNMSDKVRMARMLEKGAGQMNNSTVYCVSNSSDCSFLNSRNTLVGSSLSMLSVTQVRRTPSLST